MATVLLDPGGDSTFDTTLESVVSGTVTVVSDFVHGGHQKSYKFATGGSAWVSPNIAATDAGGRVSHWFYFNALPTGTTELIDLVKSGPGAAVAMVLMTSGGVVLLGNGSTQLGSNGPTLTTGNWYRISFAWKITSTSVNQFLVTVADASGTVLGTIPVTNGTLVNTTSGALILGNFGGDATLDMRASDIYVDNATTVTDPGNIWVTAKRPLSNGTLNQYAVNGSAGAYGSGNARYTNERPLNTTDFVSVTPTAVQTEEYSIEGQSVGDISTTGATIVDFMGWMNAKVASTANTPVMKIILAGTSTTKTLTTANALYTQIAGSTTYPAGSTDIGMSAQYTTTGHLVTLNECGVVVAYIPSSSVNASITQVAATLNVTGGTQTIATINNTSLTQSTATVTAAGSTQSVVTVDIVAISQVVATLTATGGVQVITVNRIVGIVQVAANITATAGSQGVQDVQDVSIIQVVANITVSGGSQTVTTVNNVAISQVVATITASGGSQAIQTIQDIQVTQLGAVVSALAGTQTVAGNVLVMSSVAQIVASITATGGTQAVTSINAVSVTQVAAFTTTTGGTQSITTIQNLNINQSVATITIAGGTQSTQSIQNVSISHVAAQLTITSGIQTIVAQIDISITQVAVNLNANGGVQAVSAGSGTSSAAITQVGSSMTATGGLQIISINTSPLPSSHPSKVIFLLDGRLAIRVSNNIYIPI